MQKKIFFYDMKTNNTNLLSMKVLVKSIRLLLKNADLEEFYLKVFAPPLYTHKNIKTKACEVDYEICSFGSMEIGGRSPVTIAEVYKKLFELLLKASNIDDLLIVFDGLEFDVISEEEEKKTIIESNQDLKIVTRVKFSTRTGKNLGLYVNNDNSDAISLIGVAFSNPLFFHDTYENFIGGHAYDCSGVYVGGEGGKEVSLIDEEGQGDTKAVYPLEPFWKLRLEYQERVYDVKKNCRLIQIAWDGKEFGLYVEYEE